MGCHPFESSGRGCQCCRATFLFRDSWFSGTSACSGLRYNHGTEARQFAIVLRHSARQLRRSLSVSQIWAL